MTFNQHASISDLLNLLKKISIRRFFNYAAIQVSYGFSRLFRKPKVWAQPFSIHIETSAICNLKCPECKAGTGKTSRKNRYPDLDLIKGILTSHRKTAFYCNLYFQGEPFLNPRIFEIIEHASDLNYYSVISTNGHFLSDDYCERLIKSKLSKIIVSLDGISESSYKSYRVGGDFHTVLDGIKKLAKMKRNVKALYPLLVIQFLVNKTNELEMNEAAMQLKEAGVDRLEFKTMQIYSEDGKEKFNPANKQYSRYRTVNQNYRNSCFRLWSHIVYTSDGVVVPCCYDKDPEFPLAVARINDYTHPWKSDAFQKFRKNFLHGTPPEICLNCNG